VGVGWGMGVKGEVFPKNLVKIWKQKKGLGQGTNIKKLCGGQVSGTLAFGRWGGSLTQGRERGRAEAAQRGKSGNDLKGSNFTKKSGGWGGEPNSLQSDWVRKNVCEKRFVLGVAGG